MLFQVCYLTTFGAVEHTLTNAASFGAAIFITNGTSVNQHIAIFFMI